jgi:hypothetical protein
MPVIEISLDWNIKKRSVNHVKEKVSTHFSVAKLFMINAFKCVPLCKECI